MRVNVRSRAPFARSLATPLPVLVGFFVFFWLLSQASPARAEEQGPKAATPGLYDYYGTPREGVLSGGYFALDVGLLAIDKAVRDRVGIGLGPGVDVRVGAEFWDHVIVGAGMVLYFPADHRPTSEVVVTCTTVNGQPVDCDPPGLKGSAVGGTLLNFEAGYQHRFRPWLSSSLTPGALVGFTAVVHPPKRGVDCEGCPDPVALPVSTSGVFVAPLFRVTLGEKGNYAVVARSQIFLTSDLMHFTTLGVEMGLP